VLNELRVLASEELDSRQLLRVVLCSPLPLIDSCHASTKKSSSQAFNQLPRPVKVAAKRR
jgi:hypothetical protein